MKLFYFDLKTLRRMEYVLGTHEIVTSLSCSAGRIMYSLLYDSLIFRELLINTTTEEIYPVHQNVTDFPFLKRPAGYESLNLHTFTDGPDLILLNSYLRTHPNKTRSVELLSYQLVPDENPEYDQLYWVRQGDLIFSKTFESFVTASSKKEILKEHQAFISAHSGKSFMLTLDRESLFSIDWQLNTTSTESPDSDLLYFESFVNSQTNDDIIGLVANDIKSSVAAIYTPYTHKIHLVIRHLSDEKTGIMKENYKTLAMGSLPLELQDIPLKSLRIERIPPSNETSSFAQLEKLRNVEIQNNKANLDDSNVWRTESMSKLLYEFYSKDYRDTDSNTENLMKILNQEEITNPD